MSEQMSFGGGQAPTAAASVDGVARRQKIAATGGVLGAIAASSCCILPLVLFSVGLGGAWIGNLAALSPYQPISAAIALGFLGYGYWLVYRRPKAACADGEACARPVSGKLVHVALWSATVLVAAALAFPYAAPFLLDI